MIKSKILLISAILSIIYSMALIAFFLGDMFFGTFHFMSWIFVPHFIIAIPATVLTVLAYRENSKKSAIIAGVLFPTSLFLLPALFMFVAPFIVPIAILNFIEAFREF